MLDAETGTIECQVKLSDILHEDLTVVVAKAEVLAACPQVLYLAAAGWTEY